MGATDFGRAADAIELERGTPHTEPRVVPTSVVTSSRAICRARAFASFAVRTARETASRPKGASTSARAEATRGRESRRRVVVFRRGAYSNLSKDERPPFHSSWEVPCGLLGARRAARSRDDRIFLDLDASTTRRRRRGRSVRRERVLSRRRHHRSYRRRVRVLRRGVRARARRRRRRQKIIGFLAWLDRRRPGRRRLERRSRGVPVPAIGPRARPDTNHRRYHRFRSSERALVRAVSRRRAESWSCDPA